MRRLILFATLPLSACIWWPDHSDDWDDDDDWDDVIDDDDPAEGERPGDRPGEGDDGDQGPDPVTPDLQGLWITPPGAERGAFAITTLVTEVPGALDGLTEVEFTARGVDGRVPVVTTIRPRARTEVDLAITVPDNAVYGWYDAYLTFGSGDYTLAKAMFKVLQPGEAMPEDRGFGGEPAPDTDPE